MCDYYNLNGWQYFLNTINIHLKKEYQVFESNLVGKNILDVGSGSGRDSLYFSHKGFQVKSIDKSKQMCKISANLDINISCQDVKDIYYNNQFDGIWCSMSLLHCKLVELPNIINKLYKALKDDGIMYLSFKYGQFEGIRDDRYYTDMTEKSLMDLIDLKMFSVIQMYISTMISPVYNKQTKVINLFIKKEKL